MEKLITIFTPTYNRADYLTVLFKALCRQEHSNFVWLIVDDGSTDNTRQIVENWQHEKSISFDIEYIYQENSGKMAAHNVAVEKCVTPIFVDVDSDDTPKSDFISVIEENSETLFSYEKAIALIAPYEFVDKKNDSIDMFCDGKLTTISALSKAGYHGETTLVFKTDLLKQYKFPFVEGEKFIPEGYIYKQMEMKYVFCMINKSIVCGQYLVDGYSKQYLKLLKENPNSFALLHEQNYNITGEINYLIKSMSYHMLGDRSLLRQDIIKYPISLLLFPIALLISVKRLIQYKKAGLY